MLTSAAGIAFLPSTDLQRSRQFFEQRLGLSVQDVSDFACVLDAGSTTLRVTRVDHLTPQPFTVFGWRVEDLRPTVAELAAGGITCLQFDGLDQDPSGIWTTPGGDLVAWFTDPDGNVLSLTQHARPDRPDPGPSPGPSPGPTVS
jgi:catechol 2,3-dioxygenase-like lactoylglutathione lyase family enzyme